MDPADLVKAAPEIAKGVAAVSAAIPLTAIVKRMFGPAADEVAEMWRDKVRLYRYERQLKCVEKAERMAQEAGFTPQAVPPKLLFPLLEGASFEDNEDLHTMWAALLANAASPENAGKVRPGFIATLRQMSADEAVLLNWIFSQRTGVNAGPFDAPLLYPDLLTAYHNLRLEVGTDPFRYHTCVQSLQSAELIEERQDIESLGGRLNPAHSLTFRGLSFMFACRPPTRKK